MTSRNTPAPQGPSEPLPDKQLIVWTGHAILPDDLTGAFPRLGRIGHTCEYGYNIYQYRLTFGGYLTMHQQTILSAYAREEEATFTYRLEPVRASRATISLSPKELAASYDGRYGRALDQLTLLAGGKV